MIVTALLPRRSGNQERPPQCKRQQFRKPLTAAAIFRPAKPGRIVQVRPVLKQDRDGLGALYTRASSRSRYLRFFTAGISIDREVQRLIAPADDHVALLAEHDGLAVGVASYEILSDDQAEFAVLVDDAWQGEGVGSLLIEQLAAMARRAGIRV